MVTKNWKVALMGEEKRDETGSGRLPIPAPVVKVLSEHTTSTAAENARKKLSASMYDQTQVVYVERAGDE